MATRRHNENWLFNWLSYVLCYMGFYQKIRNVITDRWMRLKVLQNKQKIKYNVSFISIPYFPRIQMIQNWPSGTPPSSLFYSRPSPESSGRLLSMCSVLQCPLQMIWKFPWLQWMDSSNPVHHASCRIACCLWHQHTSVEHPIPCTESNQITQVEQDRLQQWLVYTFWFETTTQSLRYLLTHLQYLHNRLLSTTWFEDEPQTCIAEYLQMLEVKPSLGFLFLWIYCSK